MTLRRAALAGALLVLCCLLPAGSAALAADHVTAPARIAQQIGADAPALAPLAAPKATPTPAPTPTSGGGLSGGQLFLGAILVAVGVAGATFMLVLMRTLRKHPPPTS
jgi:hypothetical protein